MGIPILRLKDADGNVVPVPAIQGADGKSAYEFALEGGYTGSEEEFAEQLAQHPEIEVVYFVTDYESSFVAMTQALEGKKTYQLYRDYLDNFRINTGRN